MPAIKYANLIYPLAVASLLIAAGGFKIHQLTGNSDENRWYIAALALFEIGLGAWLLAGFQSRLSRMVVLAVFITYLNVAVAKGIDGLVTCGCFGSIVVHPWYVAIADFAVIIYVGFLVPLVWESHPSLEFKRSGLVLAMLLMGIGFVLTAIAIFPRNPAPRLSESDKHLVARIRDSIADHHNRYESLSGSMERTMRNLKVDQEKRYVSYTKDGKIDSIATFMPMTRHIIKFDIRGKSLRKEMLESGISREIETIHKGRHLEYHPQINQAWIRDERTSGWLFDPVDPRCLGFNTPLWHLPDWFGKVRVENIQPYQNGDDHGLSLTAIDLVNYKSQVRFSEKVGYLPVNATLVDAHNSMQSIVTWNYFRIASAQTWFPDYIKITNTQMVNGQLDTMPLTTVEYTTKQPIVLNEIRDDKIFDIELAKKCYVIDLTKTTPPIELTQQAPFSTIMLKENVTRQPRKFFVLSTLNILLIGLFVANMNRLRL